MWTGTTPPTVADVERRLAEIEAERQKLVRYLEALNGVISTNDGAPRPGPRTWNPEVSLTGEVAKQALLKHGSALELDAMLPIARSFKNWNASGDNQKDKNRLYAAMYRAQSTFAYTDAGWDLVERVRQ